MTSPSRTVTCRECGSRMWLTRINSQPFNLEQRTYECTRCFHEVMELFEVSVEAAKAAPWMRRRPTH
jgi:DNA-directed RNA polymerase subunit RPC12/RpoP